MDEVEWFMGCETVEHSSTVSLVESVLELNTKNGVVGVVGKLGPGNGGGCVSDGGRIGWGETRRVKFYEFHCAIFQGNSLQSGRRGSC